MHLHHSMTMPRRYRFHGTVALSPFCDKVYRAELRVVRLITESDFRNMAAFEHEHRVPVLVSYSQHYEILRDIVITGKRMLPLLEYIIVRYRSPYLVRLPGELLHAQVLLVDDPEPVVRRLLWAGTGEVLRVWDGLRRDSIERGTNKIEMTLYTRNYSRADFRRFLDATIVWRSMTARAIVDDQNR